MIIFCCVMTECESVEPESVACQTGSKHAATTIRRRHHRTSYVADKDAHCRAESGFQRSLQTETFRRRSAVDEDLYCPMNGVRFESGQRRLARNTVAQNTPANLYRACSDETLSLHSHSRRLQQKHRETVKPTATPNDRRMSALNVNSATRRSHSGRDRHHRTVAAQPVVNTSSGKSRRTVVHNRPDLLCTWKDHDDWNDISPPSCGGIGFSGPQRSSPPDDNLRLQHTGTNETVTGTVPATTQSPQSVLSDGSPGSLYPIAPAASPVTLNSLVFSPPPFTSVSSSATAVWSTAASFPPRPLVMDSRSNPDSGSKIYRWQSTVPVADPVTSHSQQPVETGVNTQSRVCSSFPDVVVDQPVYCSGHVISAATLPRMAFDPSLPSGRQHCQCNTSSPPTNLDLMTYSETNLVVSPRRIDHRQSRVPIELADDSTVLEGSEAFSPKSPLSLDSVDSVAEKVADCCLLSPTNNVSISATPAEVPPCPDVPQPTEFISNPPYDLSADEQLPVYYSVNSVSETGNQILGGGISPSSVTEDARQFRVEFESYQEAGNYCSSPLSVEASFDHIVATVESPQIKDKVVDYQVVDDVRSRCLQIGRCTTV